MKWTRARRLLAAAATILGALAPFAGSPYLSGHARVDDGHAAVVRGEDEVEATELATWLKDRKPGLQVIDVRSQSELDPVRIPGARHLALESLSTTPFRSTDTLVLISDDLARAALARALLRAGGHPRVYVLRGGVKEWLAQIISPARPSEISRYFGGVPRVGGGKPATMLSVRRRGC